MDWTDEQLKIILWTINQADNGCCHCVGICLREFIERSNNKKLLPRLKALFTKEMNCRYSWEELEPNLCD